MFFNFLGVHRTDSRFQKHFSSLVIKILGHFWQNQHACSYLGSSHACFRFLLEKKITEFQGYVTSCVHTLFLYIKWYSHTCDLPKFGSNVHHPPRVLLVPAMNTCHNKYSISKFSEIIVK